MSSIHASIGILLLLSRSGADAYRPQRQQQNRRKLQEMEESADGDLPPGIEYLGIGYNMFEGEFRILFRLLRQVF